MLPGRPTRDCLFSDPARDGKSLLKIWNMNDYTGVIGAFNCQGAGWCKVGKRNLIHDEQPGTITGIVRASDVNYLHKIADAGWSGDVVVYAHLTGEVVYLPQNASWPITLKAKEYEVFTVSPAKKLSNWAIFAPIGLIKMFNSGGAIKGLKYESERTDVVSMKVLGCGLFGAYSSTRPTKISVDEEETDFEYEDTSGKVLISLRTPEKELYLWNISIEL